MKTIFQLFIALLIFMTMGLIACVPTTADAVPTPVLIDGQTEDSDETNEEPPVDGDSGSFDLEVVPPVRGGDPHLVYVDSVEVMILESFPVQVLVALSGSLADGCVSVENVTPRFIGDGWEIDIEANRPADMMCTAVLVPFEQTVALDVNGLAAGTYSVQVLDQTSSFTLDIDNSSTESYSDIEIRLERTMCFGFCPAYIVTILGDGTVTFEGLEHVDQKGIYTININPNLVQELARQIEEMGYFQFEDEYTNYEITDAPSAYTAVTINGRTKEVAHYYGDQSAPDVLFEIEALIDSLSQVEQWVGDNSAN